MSEPNVRQNPARCEARGTHKNYNWVRNVYCSLPVGHKGRHVAYWSHVVTDEWTDGERGEVGGPGAGRYYDWQDAA